MNNKLYAISLILILILVRLSFAQDLSRLFGGGNKTKNTEDTFSRTPYDAFFYQMALGLTKNKKTFDDYKPENKSDWNWFRYERGENDSLDIDRVKCLSIFAKKLSENLELSSKLDRNALAGVSNTSPDYDFVQLMIGYDCSNSVVFQKYKEAIQKYSQKESYKNLNDINNGFNSIKGFLQEQFHTESPGIYEHGTHWAKQLKEQRTFLYKAWYANDWKKLVDNFNNSHQDLHIKLPPENSRLPHSAFDENRPRNATIRDIIFLDFLDDSADAEAIKVAKLLLNFMNRNWNIQSSVLDNKDCERRPYYVIGSFFEFVSVEHRSQEDFELQSKLAKFLPRKANDFYKPEWLSTPEYYKYVDYAIRQWLIVRFAYPQEGLKDKNLEGLLEILQDQLQKVQPYHRYLKEELDKKDNGKDLSRFLERFLNNPDR